MRDGIILQYQLLSNEIDLERLHSATGTMYRVASDRCSSSTWHDTCLMQSTNEKTNLVACNFDRVRPGVIADFFGMDSRDAFRSKGRLIAPGREARS